MKTFISDIVPRLRRFSEKLDNITLLTRNHWVIIDDQSDSKNVYIFRLNNELLISQDGKVEKAKWEYLGNNSLLIDRRDDSFLFRHGFLDEIVLALKLDNSEEYAFLVNEQSFEQIHTLGSTIKYLEDKYLTVKVDQRTGQLSSYNKVLNSYSTPQGSMSIEHFSHFAPTVGDKVFMVDLKAPNGKYRLGFANYIIVENGIITELRVF